jgi:hypothetical protein
MDGGWQMVTVAVVLSAGAPQLPLTRTQYELVAAGEAEYDEFVAPLIGSDVSPLWPAYHW